ncbi:MAG: aconitase family protein, partial [Nitrososphaera sp.]|uniref:aconitase family protein n=1 Tax=Nitrososphaera sp. TaxID=1971748 RepID=UPI003D6FB205
VKTRVSLQVTPGSEMIRATIERDGQMQVLKEIGANVLANACGPCIGQWSRPELKKGEPNTIITSYNRNFPGRNDGRRETMNFIGSPELVIAMALGGRLSFNPLTDELEAPDGSRFRLKAPGQAPEVPKGGFVAAIDAYIGPAADPDSIEIVIDPQSDRLQKLEPFARWDGQDLKEMPVLAKTKGKTTTDHISPAGAWLTYRGHLDRISDNLLLGATNAYTGQVGSGKNQLNARVDSFPKVARDYKAHGLKWAIVGDSNYGEGSSREHAAMTPRYLGCVAVIARSFARIHETNLKKQGVLALTFANAADYDRVLEDDRISVVGLEEMQAGKPLKCILHHASGEAEEISLKHSYNAPQIEWFKAGSALNLLRSP